MLPVRRTSKCSLSPVGKIRVAGNLSDFFDDFWQGVESSLVPSSLQQLEIDMYEDKDNLYIEAAMPGVKRDDIEITLEDGVLRVQTTSKDEHEEQRENYFMRERYVGQRSRSIRLPVDVQIENLNASLEDGVLKIVLAKAEQQKMHKIEVK